MVPHIEQAIPAVPAVLMYVAYQACRIIIDILYLLLADRIYIIGSAGRDSSVNLL